MKKLLLCLAGATAIVIVLDLHAQQAPQGQSSPSSPNRENSAKILGPQATQPVIPVIGTVGLTPSAIAYGSPQPVIASVDISDPNYLPGTANLIQILSTGSRTLGTLHDDGLNGDFASNDHTFSLIVPGSSVLSTGTVNLQISVAVRGQLKRATSAIFSLTVVPSQITAGWATLSDAQNLFSLLVPPSWTAFLTEAYDSEGFQVKAVSVNAVGGKVPLIVSVYTDSGWLQEVQSEAGSASIYLGKKGQWTFAYSFSQDDLAFAGFTDAQVLSQIRQMLATFQMK